MYSPFYKKASSPLSPIIPNKVDTSKWYTSDTGYNSAETFARDGNQNPGPSFPMGSGMQQGLRLGAGDTDTTIAYMQDAKGDHNGAFSYLTMRPLQPSAWKSQEVAGHGGGSPGHYAVGGYPLSEIKKVRLDPLAKAYGAPTMLSSRACDLNGGCLADAQAMYSQPGSSPMPPLFARSPTGSYGFTSMPNFVSTFKDGLPFNSFDASAARNMYRRTASYPGTPSPETNLRGNQRAVQDFTSLTNALARPTIASTEARTAGFADFKDFTSWNDKKQDRLAATLSWLAPNRPLSVQQVQAVAGEALAPRSKVLRNTLETMRGLGIGTQAGGTRLPAIDQTIYDIIDKYDYLRREYNMQPGEAFEALRQQIGDQQAGKLKRLLDAGLLLADNSNNYRPSPFSSSSLS